MAGGWMRVPPLATRPACLPGSPGSPRVASTAGRIASTTLPMLPAASLLIVRALRVAETAPQRWWPDHHERNLELLHAELDASQYDVVEQVARRPRAEGVTQP